MHGIDPQPRPASPRFSWSALKWLAFVFFLALSCSAVLFASAWFIVRTLHGPLWAGPLFGGLVGFGYKLLLDKFVRRRHD